MKIYYEKKLSRAKRKEINSKKVITASDIILQILPNCHYYEGRSDIIEVVGKSFGKNTIAVVSVSTCFAPISNKDKFNTFDVLMNMEFYKNMNFNVKKEPGLKNDEDDLNEYYIIKTSFGNIVYVKSHELYDSLLTSHETLGNFIEYIKENKERINSIINKL